MLMVESTRPSARFARVVMMEPRMRSCSCGRDASGTPREKSFMVWATARSYSAMSPSMRMTETLTPRVWASCRAPATASGLVSGEGMMTAETLCAPRASTAMASTNPESMPPEILTRAFSLPHLWIKSLVPSTRAPKTFSCQLLPTVATGAVPVAMSTMSVSSAKAWPRA